MLVFGLCSLSAALLADEAEANVRFNAGLSDYKSGRYVEAADNFMAARLLTDTPSMKLKALERAAMAYRNANLRLKEFECVETMLNAYPSLVDFKQLVDREYEIGNAFFAGHRDPAYWSLRWIPWLTGEDMTESIYSAALGHAPFSSYAPQARLRLARMYIDDGKSEKALIQLRELTGKYPDSEEKRYGYLELVSALMHLARFGDGDGAYNREANEVMELYLRKYPDSKEADWIRKRVLEAKDINARRLYDLARFYQRTGVTKPAERYLNKVLREYPDSLSADNSERLLSKLDRDFSPLKFRPEIESRFQSFEEKGIPAVSEPVMITPEGSNGKWLLPIRDLGLGNKIAVKRENISGE